MEANKDMTQKGDIIFTRRSIRKYNKAKINAEQLHYLLDAAMSAPSARNRKPWHFIVVTSPRVLELLSREHPYASMLSEASAAVLVCGDVELEPMESYIIQACSAATQNLLLAAHASGLGAVWLGVHPREERSSIIRKIFNIPSNILPVSLISVGYPAEEKPRNQNYDAGRVHFDIWGD